MSFAAEHDELIRSSAFAHLRVVQLTTGGPVRREHVSQFESEGERIALMDPQRGIRKPRQLDAALSFRTVHADGPGKRPYDDIPGPDGFLRYKWRGTDASHSENRAMRTAMERRLPLIWFHGIDVGVYLPLFPVWLLAEERELHQFVVALDLIQLNNWDAGTSPDELQREHALVTAKVRLHQPMFRARVLAAYETRCSICHLRHQELLDAAHIRPDSEGGEPVVPNGLSLCKIHHAAYDSKMIGIDSDYRISVRSDVLQEIDGPTLRHSIQEVHGSTLQLPRRRAARPDRDLLGERFERFLSAGAA